MGWFDSLLGADERKFIKRKDSDAGEAGLSESLNYIVIFMFVYDFALLNYGYAFLCL